MPRRVFTPAVISAIRDLANQGKSSSVIAAAIGSTAASVRVNCSRLKIRLSRRGRSSLVPSWSHEHKLVIYMRPQDYAALKRKAAHKCKSPVELAGMLLEAIVSADIFEAVLDDRV
jgi:hypothetical protein